MDGQSVMISVSEMGIISFLSGMSLLRSTELISILLRFSGWVIPNPPVCFVSDFSKAFDLV